MKRLILAAMLIACPVFAQQQTDERTTKLVQLKYVEPDQIRNLISMFGVSVNIDNRLRVMTLSGKPSAIQLAEEAIAKLDVPAKSVELVVYFVVGSDQPNLPGAAVPAEVHDVIAQLKNVFTFKDYRMLDTLTVRTRAGSPAETTGIIDSRTSNPRLSVFSVHNVSLSEDGSTVRLDRMHAGLRIPTVSENNKLNYMNTGIDQDVDVKAGQKVVVGRASLEGPDKALFLILTAKVVQ